MYKSVKMTPNSLVCCNQATTTFSTAAIECAITEGIFCHLKGHLKLYAGFYTAVNFKKFFKIECGFFVGQYLGHPLVI